MLSLERSRFATVAALMSLSAGTEGGLTWFHPVRTVKTGFCKIYATFFCSCAFLYLSLFATSVGSLKRHKNDMPVPSPPHTECFGFQVTLLCCTTPAANYGAYFNSMQGDGPGSGTGGFGGNPNCHGGGGAGTSLSTESWKCLMLILLSRFRRLLWHQGWCRQPRPGPVTSACFIYLGYFLLCADEIAVSLALAFFVLLFFYRVLSPPVAGGKLRRMPSQNRLSRCGPSSGPLIRVWEMVVALVRGVRPNDLPRLFLTRFCFDS